ncbi:Gfo/Idh/MocA family protein [Nocardioides marmorisolisilvae]|uniref:Gfo/Idh/MocA family oxidoreductase n=1 Tax=Nocardioides marmorisolisilvae TaxID=1542737 RepID=A0A3N0DQ55_9ACTN|nr:Gfo/Idh/MocA family oxidoreductase [Nocardioides marmorisolisilvae]RNL77611.1 gfo/Idh/MocA family oxidoreductase [Nocardioides marmorisolisilvae]
MNGLDRWSPIAAEVDITIPEEHKLPIAIVGAGVIVDVAHLPAYAAAGLEVVGLYDLDAERASMVAKKHGIQTVYPSLEALLADERVRVVDIAVVADAQPDIVEAAIAAGKHLLCQKPFVRDLARGRQLIAQAEVAGVHLVVNQQMRSDEGIAVTRAVLRAGWIGEPAAMSFNVDIGTDWSAWPWLVSSERLEINFHSIHYLDSIRSILGDPTNVFCAGGRRPGQIVHGETRTMSTLVFDNGVNAVLHVNHENLGGDYRAEFRLDGSEGSVRGTLGLLYNYPHGRPDTVEVFSNTLPTDGWLSYPVTKRWLPDAFLGPMAGLLRWIATGEPSMTAAADNLRTLALVDALYRSMDTGTAQPVAP